ncbi:MAG: right-handed parallel beta-helix repeat-containing protein [Parvularculaceae bacterium]|nr:right-handed parallel beta-helix repeat-containing protein [Parvularculaceae bacterium]
MKRTFTIAVAGGMSLLAAGYAAAQSLGGFPIREPGAHSGSGSPGPGAKPAKGPMQIIVDANGPGPYKTISAAVKDVAEGGMVYVMHGVYNESVTINKSILIQGDRGPGSGVEIIAPANEPCMTFAPTIGTSHAVVANISMQSKVNSRPSACLDIGSGVFTLRESNVMGSTLAPSIRVAGGTAVLEKNTIAQGSQGIVLAQPHTLSQAFIVDNKITGNQVGVDITNVSRGDVVVSGNEIFKNQSKGVASSGYGATMLIGNKIRNNTGSGVMLERYTKLALVRYNEIVSNDGDGVEIPSGVNGLIEENQIVGNRGASIVIHSGAAPKITNNVISNNGGDRSGKKSKKTKVKDEWTRP